MIATPRSSWVIAELVEIMVVEKMPERAVPHVVQQPRHPHQAFDVGPRGDVAARFAQRIVPVVDGQRGQVHDPQDVLEAGMLGRRKDPPGRLQLVNLPHPLDPRMVDDLLFRDFARRQARSAR